MPTEPPHEELNALAPENQIGEVEECKDVDENSDLPDGDLIPINLQSEVAKEPKLFTDKVFHFNKSVNDWVGCLTRIAFLLLGIGLAGKILITLPASADLWIVRYPLFATLICLIIITFVFTVSLSAQTFFTAMKFIPETVSESKIVMVVAVIYYSCVTVVMFSVWWGVIHMTVFVWNTDAIACMSDQFSTECATSRQQSLSDLQKLKVW